MIPFVLCVPLHQVGKAQKLIDYCKVLDGTEVKLIVIEKQEDEIAKLRFPKNTFPCLQAMGLRKAAIQMASEPFGWLEIDSIPIKKGWAKILTDEYHRLKKPFMISSDSHPPGDLVGGIGIYAGDTHRVIPVEIEKHGWDMWMINNIPEKISRTPLIQHNYAIYPQGEMHKERDITFPRDKDLIRKDAVLFHSSKDQSLMKYCDSELGLDFNRIFPTRFHFTNDIGDFIAAMPIVRQLGGGSITIGNHPEVDKGHWRRVKGSTFEAIAPLLRSLPYVSSVEYAEDRENADYDFTDWRQVYDRYRSLTHNQAAYFNIHEVDTSPWLTAKSDPRTKGKIIVARSARYHNTSFPWMDLGRRYSGRFVFLGHPDEHKAWQKAAFSHAQYIPTKDFKEVAELVQGCEFAIVNQTSISWVAMGLGKKLIQETYISNPDSKIQRPENQYVDGAVINYPKL